MRLTWHGYTYYPYERDLAAREIMALFGKDDIREVSDGIELHGAVDPGRVERLTYFSGRVNGCGVAPTVQAKLEQAGQNGKKKQATRYSVHGLHEYKGKFNPQVVRGLLNIFGIEPGQRVIDPFCGSGTTLVECAHLGAVGVGTDINPLAILIARAKLQALCTPAAQLEKLFERLSKSVRRAERSNVRERNDARSAYLKGWFDIEVLEEMECIHSKVEQLTGESTPVFLALASNLLRDYSQQDPKDLRTRRRKSALPKKPFTTAFLEAVPPLLKRIEAAQEVLGTDLRRGHALLRDVTTVAVNQVGGAFDAAVTSPPYAMALPYIDTQRLSLVWLGLCRANKIAELEAELIGSREMRGKARQALLQRLQENADNLPSAQSDICITLQRTLNERDGFRRRAVPLLLYRYFSSMKKSFKAVKALMKSGAPYGLIVGHNRTTIGGVQHEINTPAHLASLAVAEGWQVDELIPLQTYRRYGYHVSNAVSAETLIILRNA